MRSKIRILTVILALIFTSVIFAKRVSAQQPYVSFQVFYDELSPYGDWVNYQNLGYVWIPDAGPEFVPYSTEGHWIYTEYGWTWMSDYVWGWAPFHYGRWDYDNYYGWLWVPDSEWGPAWVSWRRAEGYYGWAPMEPGISLSLSFSRGYDSHNNHWIFVRDRDIDRSDINHYYVNRTEENRIIRGSSVINNTYIDSRRNSTYVSGPGREDFQKASGRQINTVAVGEYNKPGQDLTRDHLNIYRPAVNRNTENGQRSAPSKITNLKDVKQPSQRNDRTQIPNSNSGGAVNKESQLKNTNPQRNMNNERTLPQQNANPVQSIRKDQQQNNVRERNINPPRNVQKEQPQNNIRQQNANPPQNIRKDPPQNNVRQQSATPGNITREQPKNNMRQQNSTPPQNIRTEKSTNSSKSTGNGRKEQKTKSETSKDKIKQE
jgi:hypothetical protein